MVELFKTETGVYAPTTNSLAAILHNTGSFKGIKESFRYTLDVKPKFGYIPIKISLRAPSMYDPSVLKCTQVLIFEPESESEFKNLNTVFKYFMVLDQNRRILNRFFKIESVDISPRLQKIESLLDPNISVKKETPFFSLNKPAFEAILQYNIDGTTFTKEGLSPTYDYQLVKSNTMFVNDQSSSSTRTYDADLFSPIKYNTSPEVSSSQTNIRSKKKLLFNQRLLHTTSVLVLPTKLNITVITNSYDVIHS